MDMLLMVCVHAYGDLRLMSGPLYPPPVLIIFPVPTIKYPRESEVEKVFILFSLFWGVVATTCKFQSTFMEKSRWQGPETSGHICSQEQSEGMHICLSSVDSLLFIQY